MLLDTHVWIGTATADRRKIGPKTRRLLAKTTAANPTCVSTASVFEVTALHVAGRVRFNQPVERWIRESIDRGNLRVIDVEQGIAVDAGMIPAAALADPIDRVLVATAREYAIPLVTCDRRILDYARRTGLVRVVDGSA